MSQTNSSFRKLTLFAAFTSMFVFGTNAVFAQDNTEETSSDSTTEISEAHQEQLDELKALVGEAGQLFKAEEFAESADTVRAAQKLLIELAETGLSEIHTALENDYTRIKKAQGLLGKHDLKFDELKDLDEYMTISFVSAVVPIIMKNCGECHVDQTKGRFSAASFKALLDAESFVAGEPADSPLIEIIESGEMPPGRKKKVSSKDLKVLKEWIEAGARFDGEDEETNLADLKPKSGGAKKTFR